MVFSKFKSKLFVLGVLISFQVAFVLNVAADELRVKAGEYVVEYNPIQVSQLNLEGADFQALKTVAPNVELVTVADEADSVLGISQLNSDEVAYDPNDTFCAELIASGVAVACSPNFIYTINRTPNDSSFSQLWGLSSVGAEAGPAWDVTTGSSDVVVAVIDSGVNYNHPDLIANMWVNPQEIPGNGIDDDRNGYVDDIHGISAVNGSGDPMDDNGHGTHVAGTVGARGNNGVGVVGVNWNVKIMGLKFITSSGGGTLSDAIEAINYMVQMKNRGVNIVVSNNSWGGRGFSSTLQNTIEASIESGIAFVAAAGNEGVSNDQESIASYPASYPLSGIVSVAAMDRNQNLANFSNHGSFSVDIAAPGVDILSTHLGGSYRSLSGTSMAAPHVAGALALLASVQPGYSSSQLITALYQSGVDYPTLTGQVATGRKLNLNRLVRNVTSPVPNPELPESGCAYTSNTGVFVPNSAVDNSAVVLRGDEGSFHTVNLPFNFPLYNDSFSQMQISLNGVIYFGNPLFNDFRNQETAAANSISVFQTDMISDVDPEGIRVVSDSNSVTVSWLVKHYLNRLGGRIEAKATLFSNGQIKLSMEASDPTTIALIEDAHTIGVKGSLAGDFDTYSYNGSAGVSDRLHLTYNLSCSAPTPGNPGAGNPGQARVNQISAFGLRSTGQLATRLIPGKSFVLNLLGQGTGVFPLELRLEGRACRDPLSVALTNGVGNFTSVAPRFLRRYRRLRFDVDNARTTMRVRATRAARNRDRLSDEDYRRRRNRDCRRLVAALG